MRISIIIALYNTEQYIEKCIRSVYAEDGLVREDFEIIVINDGSTDQSRTIVEGLQQEYENLTLINKENGGQSTARNIGFDKAKGSYVFCLDSDDSINAATFKEALEYAESNDLDMLPIAYQRFTETGELVKGKPDNYPILENGISGGEFMLRYVVSGTMWRYFYKTEVFRDNKLKLTEGIYHEDEEFVMKFLSYTKKIAYQRHLVYKQIVRSNSTINNKDKTHRIKLLNDLLVVIKHLNTHRKKFDKNSSGYRGLSKKVEQLCVSLFRRMKQDGLNYEETKRFSEALQSENLYPIEIKENNYKFKFAAFVFNKYYFRKFYF